MDTQIMVSKAMFVDLPGAESLNQGTESMRSPQGSAANQGILGLQDAILDLASGTVLINLYHKFRKMNK